MNVTAHNPNDLSQLQQKVRKEINAKQRDRYRAVALALKGMKTKRIMKILERSKNFVQRWTYAYRDGGIEAIVPAVQPGRPTKLSRQQEYQFKQRRLSGPPEDDGGICTLRGIDAVQILEKEFGVKYTLYGVYDLLHRLGLSCLKPRPKHKKNDLKIMRQWQQEAPFLSKPSARKTRIKKLKFGPRMKSESANREL
jgi:transposase